MLADGGGLYLQVRGLTSKSWIFRYRFDGREREMGLGSLNDVTLAEARDLALEARRLRNSGQDPLEVRGAAEAAHKRPRVHSLSFDEAVERYLKTNSAGWKNAKHSSQWSNTLATYASPHIGDRAVSEIDLQDIVAILEPIWATKSETASRLRGRIETVLDWATVMKHRAGENPARWKGNLDKVLPPRSRVQKVKHHPAMKFSEVSAFYKRLSERPALSARALRFTILTAARSGEVLGACWAEIDLAAKIWTVPGDRMKAGKDHRVPLSKAAVALLRSLNRDATPDRLIFADGPIGRQLSVNAMSALLKRMDVTGVTVHGFRSTFRDWAAEQTEAANEVVEAALAHTIENKVEAAYRRGDLLAKRTALMEDWARFLSA